MKHPELAPLLFREAFDEQFKQFFEANGWRYFFECGIRGYAEKQLNNHDYMVATDSKVTLYGGNGEFKCQVSQPKTFGEALNAANKYAETNGGWAE